MNTIPLEEETPALTPREAKRTIEAILFAAGHPISYAKLAEVMSMTPGAVHKLVHEFALEYNDPTAELPRGIMLLEFDDCCQLCTMEQYGKAIREALGIRRGGNLSTSSIEVLAIVAYNEPVTRAYIDTVRGVDSSYGVNTLCEKHLIEPCGRLDVPGRPLLYRTTPDFLRVFGIASLEELPEIAVQQQIEPQKVNILPMEDAAPQPDTAEPSSEQSTIYDEDQLSL